MTTETSIFTRIINREIPANIIYEDDFVVAFLTIEPITKGHTLVVPKLPFINIFDGDEERFGRMMAVCQKVSKALVEAGLGKGVNLIMNNGKEAGQEVFHAHIHVVPRTEGDGALIEPNHITYEAGEDKDVCLQIKNKINY